EDGVDVVSVEDGAIVRIAFRPRARVLDACREIRLVDIANGGKVAAELHELSHDVSSAAARAEDAHDDAVVRPEHAARVREHGGRGERADPSLRRAAKERSSSEAVGRAHDLAPSLLQRIPVTRRRWPERGPPETAAAVL